MKKNRIRIFFIFSFILLFVISCSKITGEKIPLGKSGETVSVKDHLVKSRQKTDEFMLFYLYDPNTKYDYYVYCLKKDDPQFFERVNKELNGGYLFTGKILLKKHPEYRAFKLTLLEKVKKDDPKNPKR